MSLPQRFQPRPDWSAKNSSSGRSPGRFVCVEKKPEKRGPREEGPPRPVPTSVRSVVRVPPVRTLGRGSPPVPRKAPVPLDALDELPAEAPPFHPADAPRGRAADATDRPTRRPHAPSGSRVRSVPRAGPPFVGRADALVGPTEDHALLTAEGAESLGGGGPAPLPPVAEGRGWYVKIPPMFPQYRIPKLLSPR